MRKITGKLSDFSFPFPYLPNPRRSEEKKSSGNYLKVSIFFSLWFPLILLIDLWKWIIIWVFTSTIISIFLKIHEIFLRSFNNPSWVCHENHSFFCSFPYPVWVWWCRTYSHSFPQFTRVKELGDFIIFFFAILILVI